MTKYQEYFDRMVLENKDAFERFNQIHNQYGMDEEKYQSEFNSQGEKILELANLWENKLCSQSEKAGFGTFTSNLSEKFRSMLKSKYPLIDHIGIISVKSTFKIKKLL